MANRAQGRHIDALDHPATAKPVAKGRPGHPCGACADGAGRAVSAVHQVDAVRVVAQCQREIIGVCQAMGCLQHSIPSEKDVVVGVIADRLAQRGDRVVVHSVIDACGMTAAVDHGCARNGIDPRAGHRVVGYAACISSRVDGGAGAAIPATTTACPATE